MFISKQMVNFAYTLDYDTLPLEVISAARRYLADSVACTLAAYHAEPVNILRNNVIALGGNPEASLIGTERKVPIDSAALVNCTMLRYLDANDIYITSKGREPGHFSDVIPAIISLAEKYRKNGKELITCLVAAYELLSAVAESFHFHSRGFHALSQESFVLPIVASLFAGATKEQAVHACGLSVAGGLMVNTWLKPSPSIPMIKAVAVGLAAQRAVQAAQLAAMGVTASEDAIETAFECLGPLLHDKPADTERFAELGSRWTTPRNLVKAYPAQVFTQAAIEATLALYDRGVRAHDVDRLTLYGHIGVCGHVQGSPEAFSPKTREAADHSTPFVMAMALLRGRLTTREYDDSPWETEEYKALASRIKLVTEPERDAALFSDWAMGVRLVAEMENGIQEAVEIFQPKGHPDKPLSDDELLSKMIWLLENVAPQNTPERLLDICLTMSSPEDVGALIRACRL